MVACSAWLLSMLLLLLVAQQPCTALLARIAETPSPVGFRELVSYGFLEEAQIEDVMEMMKHIEDTNFTEMSDPLSLFRFYLTYKSDVKTALAHQKKASQFRRSFPGSIRELMKTYSPKDYYSDNETRSADGCKNMYKSNASTEEGNRARESVCFSRLAQTTPTGETISYWNIGSLKKNRLFDDMDLVRRSFTAHMEDNYQCLQTLSQEQKRLVQGHYLVDLSGFGLGDIGHLNNIKTLIDIGNMYPYMIKSNNIIRAPKCVGTLFKLIAPLLPADSRERTHIYSEDFAEALTEDLGMNITLLPKRLGGNASDDMLCTLQNDLPRLEQEVSPLGEEGV